MDNYFNYFTEIEEHFQKRRGKGTPLSPLDWSLIESFQEAGIPLETVLRGVDKVFERREKRKNRFRLINSLAYCTQAVLAEFEKQKESQVGKSSSADSPGSPGSSDRDNVLELIDCACERLKATLERLRTQQISSPLETIENAGKALLALRDEIFSQLSVDYEALEIRLSALEEKILASLISTLDDETFLSIRSEIHDVINKHRRGLKAEHISMLEKKMLNKKIMEMFGVPRLSLFYLPLN